MTLAAILIGLCSVQACPPADRVNAQPRRAVLKTASGTILVKEVYPVLHTAMPSA